jgi:hypothetical protein
LPAVGSARVAIDHGHEERQQLLNPTTEKEEDDDDEDEEEEDLVNCLIERRRLEGRIDFYGEKFFFIVVGRRVCFDWCRCV